jgi:hypothetical protein
VLKELAASTGADHHRLGHLRSEVVELRLHEGGACRIPNLVFRALLSRRRQVDGHEIEMETKDASRMTRRDIGADKTAMVPALEAIAPVAEHVRCERVKKLGSAFRPEGLVCLGKSMTGNGGRDNRERVF